MKKIQSRITQLAEIKRKNDIQILKHHKTASSIIREMEHLREIYQYFQRRNQEKNHIILQAESKELIYQGTAAMQSLLLEKKAQNNGLSEIFSQHGIFLDEEEEEDWQPPEPDEERLYTDIMDQNDYVVVTAKEIAKEDSEDIEDTLLQQLMNPGRDLKMKIIAEAQNLLIEYNGMVNEAEFLAELEALECSNIVVGISDILGHRELIERMQFEQNFVVLTIKRPTKRYYVSLFERYIKERGIAAARNIKPHEMIEKLREFRGIYFCEKDVFQYVDRAIFHCTERKGSEVRMEDFGLPYIKSNCTAKEELEQMIGLKKVKLQIEKICAVRYIQKFNEIKLVRHGNLAFSGEPGTGKSEVANLFARILAENNVTNGKFIKASRSDIIGKYLGHTSPKIKSLFEKADGGVLFIDEAGTLVSEDAYTREAITELVRFMEENPQTTVIFATYPDKIDALLELDAGLASRISQVVEFPTYSTQELIQIFTYMTERRGWQMDNACIPVLESYIKRMKQIKEHNFGNAREMRKLLEAAIENRCFDMLKNGEREYLIRQEDLHEAMIELIPKIPIIRRIGFNVS